MAVSFFGVAYTGAADRGERMGACCCTASSAARSGSIVGLRERWWETRFLSFTGGWTFVAAASQRLQHPVAILIAGLVLAAPLWRYALMRPQVMPDSDRAEA